MAKYPKRISGFIAVDTSNGDMYCLDSTDYDDYMQIAFDKKIANKTVGRVKENIIAPEDIKMKKVVLVFFENKGTDVLIFSERIQAEKDFRDWCKITNALNCASSVFVWLATTDKGKQALKKLAVELHSEEEAVVTITRKKDD